MKQFSKRLFSVALLLAVNAVSAADVLNRSYFLGHVGDPVGNGIIEFAGRTHLADQDSMYGVFSVQTGWSQNFNRDEIGKYLFNKSTNVLNVSAAPQVAGGTVDIMSYNFFLGAGFASTLTALPKMQASTTDFRVYVGLDEWLSGLHFEANLPVVWTRWNPNIAETGITAPGNLAANSFAAGVIASPSANMLEALQGGKTVTGGGTTAMAYGLVSATQKQSETKVGNCNVSLSYDFVLKEDAYLSVGVNGLFNGGGKSKAVNWFEPAVGTAGRQGVGALFKGGYKFWESDSDDAAFSAHFRGYVNHLFDATVRRSFDITGHGALSRYILVRELTAAFANAATTNIQNAINVTSLRTKVGIGVMYNLDLMLHYVNGGLNLDLGYQLWGHSKEKMKTNGWVDTISNNYGFWMLGQSGFGEIAIPMPNATDITINGAADANGTAVTVAVANATNVLASTADLNVDSGLHPSALSNTVFGNVGYSWTDNDWQPFVGGGAAGTFGMDNKAFSQWHVFLNGGLCF